MNDRRADSATGERMRFCSAILPPWCRKSPKVAEVPPLLYLHGLSSKDFVPALEQFLGSSAGLSASAVTRLTEAWQEEYRRWCGAAGGGVVRAGGAGKTSVAVEYAHRHLAEVGLAWQFPAEDPALLLAEFARLAAHLDAREVVDARDPVASVHAVLAAFPAEWLLVFDNPPGQQAVQRFLPPAGRGR